VSALREPEAEALYRAGLARPAGKGARVRCLMLKPGVSKGAVHWFLHGKRPGSPSRTFTVERVGPNRQPIYQHLDRSFGFGGTESLPIGTRLEEPPEPSPEQCTDVRTFAEVASNVPTSGHVATVYTSSECIPGYPEQALQVTLSERGSDEGKEPERVPVEPETPDVVVVAEQPHNSTILVDPSDISGHRRLAVAVILQAVEDGASEWFFASYTRNNFDFWCSVAGLDPGQVRKKAQQNGRVMTATTT
jgi:hypothetical protein